MTLHYTNEMHGGDPTPNVTSYFKTKALSTNITFTVTPTTYPAQVKSTLNQH